MEKIEIYDTTLRDGAQSEDVSFSVEDKLRIVTKLDCFGVDYIEGGWPGSNPKDTEFFKQAQKLKLKNAKLAAFGSTHKASMTASKDPGIKKLVAAKTPVITIFGKTWDFHVKEALKITNERNLELIHDTVEYLKKKADKVFFDAEHFFDGYKANSEYALQCLEMAVKAGADRIILCDTNGGTMHNQIEDIVGVVKNKFKTPVGIHAHNDSDCAVANSIAAVLNGATQVQGTINGLGERCGNANLISVIADLQLKLNYRCITKRQLSKSKEVSRFVSEVANLRIFKRQPFVGDSAFAHKGGIHVSAIMRHPDTYEHEIPELFGNSRNILQSDQGGRANILRKLKELNLQFDPRSNIVNAIAKEIKQMESLGYVFEGADASLELLIRKKLKLFKPFFTVHKWNVFASESRDHKDVLKKNKQNSNLTCVANVWVSTPDSKMKMISAEGNGPVNALAVALIQALAEVYPETDVVKTIDYKVRVIDTGKGTGASVRVLMEFKGNGLRWITVGVDENILEASEKALIDGINYFLLKRR